MQRGELRKSHGAWYVRFYEGKKRRAVRLGSLKEYPTKRAIQPVADEMIRRFQIAGVGRSSKLDDFIEYWYLPSLHVRASTAKGYEGLFQCYIIRIDPKPRFTSGSTTRPRSRTFSEPSPHTQRGPRDE